MKNIFIKILIFAVFSMFLISLCACGEHKHNYVNGVCTECGDKLNDEDDGRVDLPMITP